MRAHKALRLLLNAILVATATTIIAMAAASLIPPLMGLQAYAVTSSSMAPLMPPGSIALVDTSIAGDAIATGDVVAFKRGEADESICVHRAESIDKEGGSIQTKGDANDAPDLRLVPFEDVIGSVRAHVPYAGFALMWMETHRMTFLGIAIALLLASASLSFVLPRRIPSKKGRECPNRQRQDLREA